MSKTTITGLVLCLMLMAAFFFISGFLSGMRVGWHESPHVQDIHATTPLPNQAPVAVSTTPPSSNQASPIQDSGITGSNAPVEGGQTQKTMPILKTLEHLDHAPRSIRSLVVQQRVHMDSEIQSLRSPSRIYALERIAHKHKNPAPKPSPSSASTHGTYTLKVGLYPTLKEAKDAAHHVQQVGYEPSVQKIALPPQNIPRYRVCAGVFNNRIVAQKALKKLKSKGFAYAVLAPLHGGV